MLSLFKEGLSFQGTTYFAALKRAKEDSPPDATNEQIAVKINKVITTLNRLNYAFQNSGLPANSGMHRSWQKDLKYFISLSLGQLNTIRKSIELDSFETTSNISMLQKEILSLDAEVREKELELIGNYSRVHSNSFVRPEDFALQYDDQSWLVDFKTNFSFLEKYLMQPQSGLGLTLPLRRYEKSVIVDACILNERSSVGDTLSPWVNSNPRNIFLNDKIFEYSIVVREYDSTSRRRKIKTSFDNYPYNATATLTMQLELANVMYINTLKVKPISEVGTFIKKISFINENGEEVSLNSITISSQTEFVLIFEPITTKYFIIEFEQYAHVARTEVSTEDKRVGAVNKILNANGFVNELPSHSEVIQGRVYDFSFKELELGLSLYENKGIFRSLPVEISSPLGMEVFKSIETITPTLSAESDYNSTVVVPEGTVIQEAYVGVKLFDKKGNKRVESIVPVLDTGLVQLEILSPVGKFCKYKLFPDLDWSSTRICIQSLEEEEICEESLDEEAYPGHESGGSGSSGSETETDFRDVFPGIEPTGFAERPNELEAEYEDYIRYFFERWMEEYLSDNPSISNTPNFSFNSPLDFNDRFVHRKVLTNKVTSILAGTANINQRTTNVNVTYRISDETFKSFYGTLHTQLTESERNTISNDPFLYFMIGGDIYPSSKKDMVYITGKRIFKDERYNKNSPKVFFKLKLISKEKDISGNFDIVLSLDYVRTPELSKFNRILSDRIRMNLFSDPGYTIEQARSLRDLRFETLYEKMGWGVNPVTNTIEMAPRPGYFDIWTTPFAARSSSSSGTIESGSGRFPRRDTTEAECTPATYLKVTTIQKHGLHVGDVIVLSTSRDRDHDGILIRVVHIIDDYSFYTIPNSDLVDAFENAESNSVCFYVLRLTDLIEVYENGTLLTLGVDYSISLDDGSTWYNSWPASFILYSDSYRKAAAGRFLVRLNNPSHNKFYWTKYIVKRNQLLSSCGKIFLKNGRVNFDLSLSETYGTLQTILINRAISLHPYITSLVREYNLSVQTRKISNNKTAQLKTPKLIGKKTRGTLNVS